MRISALLNPWFGFFTLILIAWGLLAAMAGALAGHGASAGLGPGMQWLDALAGGSARLFGPDAVQVHSMHDSLGLLIVMWCLMSVAMMAPSAVPMLQTYRLMARGNPERIPRAGFWFVAAGFVTLWCLFSIAMAVTQRHLTHAGLLTELGLSTSLWLSAALLAAAGSYQFSALKHACLSRCRSPMAFFLSHWRDGHRGALAMGLRHGSVCVGCCWALMTLAFVGGSMNLAWMGAAMLLMIIEKLAVGRWLTVPVGIALLVAASYTAGRALFMN